MAGLCVRAVEKVNLSKSLIIEGEGFRAARLRHHVNSSGWVIKSGLQPRSHPQWNGLSQRFWFPWSRGESRSEPCVPNDFPAVIHQTSLESYFFFYDHAALTIKTAFRWQWLWRMWPQWKTLWRIHRTTEKIPKPTDCLLLWLSGKSEENTNVPGYLDLRQREKETASEKQWERERERGEWGRNEGTWAQMGTILINQWWVSPEIQ